jgi:hypothetical protein
MLIKGVQHISAWIAIAILLLFTLAACGNNGRTSSGSPSAPPPPPSPTATHSQPTTSTGCPNSTVISTQPTTANIVLKSSDANKTTTVKKGDTIEVDLPFGHNWSGPTNNTQGPLSMQNPSGYAATASQVCIWRFVASNTGTTEILFTGRPICEKNKLCPAFIMAVSFPIAVQ